MVSDISAGRRDSREFHLPLPAGGQMMRAPRAEGKMRSGRRLNRRSFLRRVAGRAAATGALGVIGGEARAWQTGPYTGVTDQDSGSHADNAGHGRGPGGNSSGQPAQPQPGQTGYSDSDSGADADPSGGGRRGQRPQTGITD